MNTYYKNQKELANALKTIIDAYWNNEFPEREMISKVNDIASKNAEKIGDNNGYLSVIKQRLGIKRLELLDKILNHTEEN